MCYICFDIEYREAVENGDFRPCIIYVDGEDVTETNQRYYKEHYPGYACWIYMIYNQMCITLDKQGEL